MERPSIRQLECAVAVADQLGFRRAAEACGITQPALSQQVRELETRVGARLFERDRRRVLVTPAGALLVERARAALLAVDEFVDAARTLREPLSGPLRLGVIPTVAPYVLPHAMPAIHRAYPELQLRLREDQTRRLVDELARGELDVVLLAFEAELGDVTTLPLFGDPFHLVVPAGDKLANRRSVATKDIGGREVLLLDDGHCLRDQALSLCQRSGVREQADFRATSLNTLVRMVAAGSGLTLLPGMSLEAELHPDDELVAVPLKERAQRTVGLAWRRSSARSDELVALGKVFREHPPEGVRVLPG